jgi:thiol:disulfide interchange protein DsbD
VSSYLDKNSINVLWEIKDGFYLYLNSVQVKKNANIIPYKVIYSEQSTYSDEFFGTTQILRKEFKIEINNSDLLDLSNILIKYQGCSDSGFCYPMQTKQIL